MHQGSCLCGVITFKVTGPLTPATACHCTQCRKQSGHVWASTNTAESALTVHGSEHLTWFQSSPDAKRGFCNSCGSALFWNHTGEDHISVAMGAFDPPVDIKLAKHIFVADKGSYYEIADGLPQTP